jgi:hypothetical protein
MGGGGGVGGTPEGELVGRGREIGEGGGGRTLLEMILCELVVATEPSFSLMSL